jgi:hypothetical protein
MFSAPFLSTLLHRVKAVVRRVARPGTERARPVAADRPVSPVLCGLAQGWMRTRLRALSALMRRIEAGERLDKPARAPSAARGPTAPAEVVPDERLPRGFGWMCAFGADVRQDGQAFAEWLGEPWMRAVVLAAPESMARAIRPILHATGTARPEWFPAVPKRRRARAVSCGAERGSGHPDCSAVADTASGSSGDPGTVCDVTGDAGEAAMAKPSPHLIRGPAITFFLDPAGCDSSVTRADERIATGHRVAMPRTLLFMHRTTDFVRSQNKDGPRPTHPLVHIVTIR